MCLRAAALIALFALLAVASAQSYCSEATKGSLYGHVIDLPVAVLPPNVQTHRVDIINVCPAGTQLQGTKVVACDYNAPPSVTLKSLVEAIVVRTGSLQNHAAVYVTLYCYNPYGASAAESLPAVQHAARPGARPAARPVVSAVSAASAPGLSFGDQE